MVGLPGLGGLGAARVAGRGRPGAGTLLAVLSGGAVVAFLAFGAAHDGAANSASVQAKAHVAAAAAGLLTLIVIRLSALVGPIIFSAADIQWILTAPGPHAPIVGGRLRRQAAALALLGATVAALVLISFSPQGRSSLGLLMAGTLVIGALTAAALPYIGWLVQSSRRASRAAKPPVLVAIAAVWTLAAVFGGSTVHTAADVLAGPLAWPFAAFAAGSGAVIAALIASVITLAAVVTVARARAGSMSLERLEQRATVRSVLTGSLATLDWRSLFLSLQSPAPAWAMRLPGFRPARPRFAALWLLATLLLRAPERLLIATALAIGTGVWAVSGAVTDDVGAVIGVSVAAILAAIAFNEPVRVAYDSGARTESILGRVLGTVALKQTLAIAALVAVLAMTGAAVAALLGGHTRALPALLIATPAMAVVSAAAATGSARAGGRFQLDVLIAALAIDPNVAMVVIVLWLIRWPLLVVGSGLVALGAAFDSTAPHGSFANVPLASAAVVLVSAAVLVRIVGWRTVRAALRTKRLRDPAPDDVALVS